MKKIFTLIVAVLIIASMSVSSFAAVTMSPYVFRSTEADGNTYIYHFGTRTDVNEEVGIEINGEKYKAENFDTTTNTKFGIGIADPSNKLTSTYTVTPYAGETYGTSVVVNKDAQSDVVFNPVYSQNYYTEKALEFEGGYEVNSEGETLSTVTGKTITIYADENYSSKKGLIKFNLNDLKGLSNGRQVYLYLYLFGTVNITSDTATLEVYGASSENYDESNLPVRDDISGSVGEVTLEKSCFTGTATNAVRVGIDVTNYIQQKAYKGESTATFFFKLADYEIDRDDANVVVYVNHSNHGTDNNNKRGVLYNPALHIVGAYNNIDDTTYPEVTFAKVGVNGYWKNTSFTKVTADYTTVKAAAGGDDYNTELGLLQFLIPDDFTGVTKGKRIILDFYAWRSTSCSSDVILETVGTYNEVIMTDTGMGTYHIRSFEEGVLGSELITSTNSTTPKRQKVSVDITDYVISKYLEGHKQFTIAFRTRYQEGVDATSSSCAYVHTDAAAEEYRPVIRYE